MAAVTGTLRGADAACRYGFNTQHDPWRASSLAWRTGGGDNGLLGALQPVDLLFEFGDLLLAFRRWEAPALQWVELRLCDDFSLEMPSSSVVS